MGIGAEFTRCNAPMPMPKLLLLSNVLLSAFLTGLIWFVQIVHYPLFRRISQADFPLFHRIHTYTTGQVVGLPMVAELLLALWMATYRVTGVHPWANYGAALCVLLVWVVTFFISVPIHNQLGRAGYDPAQIDTLVATNWLRTVAWTIRTLLLGYILWRMMP